MNLILKLEKPSKRLFKEIQKLDMEAFLTEEVNMDWYLNNYSKLEWIATARCDGELIGYRIVTGLVGTAFQMIKQGLLSGDYSLSHRSYLPVSKTNQIYLAATAVSPKFRNRGIARDLNKLIYEKIKEHHDNFELLSIAVSDGGVKIAEGLGLKRIDIVNSRRIMYARKAA